jgi:hypothetical protein
MVSRFYGTLCARAVFTNHTGLFNRLDDFFQRFKRVFIGSEVSFMPLKSVVNYSLPAFSLPEPPRRLGREDYRRL